MDMVDYFELYLPKVQSSCRVLFLLLVLWAITCLILVPFIFSEPFLVIGSGRSSEEIWKQIPLFKKIIF